MSGEIKFDMSKVYFSEAQQHNCCRKPGIYLQINWSGQPTYWREDSEGWGIYSAGRLDTRMQAVYKSFLKERDLLQHRSDYLEAITDLEKDYGTFETQLGASTCKSTLWKIQSAVCRVFFLDIWHSPQTVRIDHPSRWIS